MNHKLPWFLICNEQLVRWNMPYWTLPYTKLLLMLNFEKELLLLDRHAYESPLFVICNELLVWWNLIYWTPAYTEHLPMLNPFSHLNFFHILSLKANLPILHTSLYQTWVAQTDITFFVHLHCIIGKAETAQTNFNARLNCLPWYGLFFTNLVIQIPADIYANYIHIQLPMNSNKNKSWNFFKNYLGILVLCPIIDYAN